MELMPQAASASTGQTEPAPAVSLHRRYLDELLATIDRLSQALDVRVQSLTDAQLAGWQRETRSRSAAATLQLDGSDVDPDEVRDAAHDVLTAPDLPEANIDHAIVVDHPTWADVLKVRTPATDDADTDDAGTDAGRDPLVRRLEIEGVLRAYAADDLGAQLWSDWSTQTASTGLLSQLHRRLTAGLVSADRAGNFRASQQAVHDGATGRILYFVTQPDAIAATLAATVAAWREVEHPVLAAATLHLDVLRIHPFDAANGRLARAATNLLLRAAGVDRHRVVCIDAVLARDPLEYHEHIAAAARRSQPLEWWCWWAETIEEALLDALNAAGASETSDRGNDEVASRFAQWTAAQSPAAAWSLADARDDLTINIDEARIHANNAVQSGHARRVRGSLGLKFRSIAST